ncbi:MAG: hypothetical protein ACHWZW_08290 [Spirulina sp.]
MSLIHLDKSVLSFHFKEILEDGHFGSPLTLVGLAALMVGPKLFSSAESGSSGIRSARSAYRPGVSLTTWVAQAQQQAATKPERPTLTVAPSSNSDRWAA